jgi:hypothetical protein
VKICSTKPKTMSKTMKILLHMGRNEPTMNVALENDCMSFCPKISFSYK